MPVPHSERPLEKVREEVIDQLIINYSHAELSGEAFERRLDSAYKLQDQEKLIALCADLPLKDDPRYHSEKAARMRAPIDNQGAPTKPLKITSVLSSDERTGRWQVPKEINMTNVLGSITLDFTDAVFSHAQTYIDVNCILGADEIYVPENVEVITQTSNYMGSVSNNKHSLGPVATDKQTPTIIITGRVVLGSVNVEVKRTFKEKLKMFAHQLRSTLSDGGGKY